ncbi:hypothetical protein HC231_03830 [Brenneria izadpanahii]|uniref:Uncharacterized protein n=1 Tax=Brenneria izadpanahii TaxID=2722756 RepID=A0ABX7UNG0_9GAMM|nr:hypothetical protein [Brenneria izadpanahii]QTF07154.1 hypothetical protein HC231_03830 [Brenneria izadpanahii]
MIETTIGANGKALRQHANPAQSSRSPDNLISFNAFLIPVGLMTARWRFYARRGVRFLQHRTA